MLETWREQTMGNLFFALALTGLPVLLMLLH